MKIAKMTGIFLKEQMRTPLSIIWSVISPAVLFFFMHFAEIDKKSGNKEWLREQVGWFIGYISLSVIFFSYCLYLVGRRESGFIATFVYSRSSKIIFILSQMFASLVMLLLYVSFFLIVVYAGFSVFPGRDFFYLLVFTLAVSVLLMPCFTCLAALPVTFPTANVIFSVLLTVCMIFGVVALRTEMPIISLTNGINPILIYARVLSDGIVPEFTADTFLFYLLMLLLSMLTIYRFRIEPVWSAQ